MSQAPPIRVHALNHTFGRGELKKQILFDVSVEIQAGELVIVTGPSGSGKTTLLTLVGALRSAQDGSVQILGEQLRRARPSTLEKVRNAEVPPLSSKVAGLSPELEAIVMKALAREVEAQRSSSPSPALPAWRPWDLRQTGSSKGPRSSGIILALFP